MRVIQLSDICFPDPDKTGSVPRSAEYVAMCETLRASLIANHVTADDIILITGGLIHYDRISLETIRLFNLYIQMLTEFTHVYIMPAETDCLMRLPSPRECLLEGMCKNMQHVTFISRTNLYKIRETSFMIKSCLDDAIVPEKLDNTILVTRNYITDFAGKYKYAILSGTRVTQPHSSNTVLICGALFQNSARESHDKSYLIHSETDRIWTAQVVPVENPYGFVSVNLSNNILDPIRIQYPYEIKIHVSNSTEDAVTKCVMDLQECYKITVNLSYDTSAPSMVSLPEHELLEKLPVEYHGQFRQDWQKYTTPPGANPNIYMTWYMDELTMEKFIIYENTSIKFEPGCVGIIAANGSGKSLLLDACMMSLYKRPIRGTATDYKDASVSVSLQSSPAGSGFANSYFVTRMMNFLATNDDFPKVLGKEEITTIQKIKGIDQLSKVAEGISIAMNAAIRNVGTVQLVRPDCLSIHAPDATELINSMRARLNAINVNDSIQEMSYISEAQLFLNANSHMTYAAIQGVRTPPETIENWRATLTALIQCSQMSFNSSCSNCIHNMNTIGVSPGMGIPEIKAYLANALAVNHQLKFNEYYKYINDLKSRVTLDQERRILMSNILQCETYESKRVEYLQLCKIRDFYINYAQAFNEVAKHIFAYRIRDFETEVNNVLSRFTDFRFKLDSNYNMFILHRDIIPIHVISSSQKFLLALAIKCALNRACIIPRLNMLFIDEGFTSLDDIHMRKIPQIIEYLKSQFRTVVIISHLPEVQNNCDHHCYIANKVITRDASKVNIVQVNPMITISKQEVNSAKQISCECCGGSFKNFTVHTKGKGHIEKAAIFFSAHGRPPGPK